MSILYLVLAVFAISPLFGTQLVEKEIEGFQPTFLLPVDVTKQPVNLSVTVPKGYKSLQPLSGFGKREQVMIEYIPQNDSGDNWSEIITVNKFIGQKISAKTFASMLKTQFMSVAKNVKLIEDKSSKEKNIEDAYFLMRYTHQQKQEIIGAKYFSGPFDAAGVQYTIRLNPDLNEEAAIKKIDDFFKNNVQLMGL